MFVINKNNMTAYYVCTNFYSIIRFGKDFSFELFRVMI